MLLDEKFFIPSCAVETVLQTYMYVQLYTETLYCEFSIVGGYFDIIDNQSLLQFISAGSL